MYSANYEIVVKSEEQDILYKARGVRHENTIPYILLEQMGKRYTPCTVTYNNLTEGWRVEKAFE